jgi:hypothetical protein
LVVIEVERVDATGIFGVPAGWDDTCTAYLPIGAIGKEKGRGERKAQMHFLTTARRSVKKKNEHRMTFVARVQGVEAVSTRGVADGCPGADIGAQKYHLTVTRRGVTDTVEKETLELSRHTQRCARILVDKAAAKSGVPQFWARKVTMHTAYEKALVSHANNDDKSGEPLTIPERAPMNFLLQTIGKLEKEAVTSVIDLFPPMDDNDDVPKDNIISFASALLDLCREEKCRRSKPISIAFDTKIGAPKANMNSQLLSHHIYDTKHLVTAFRKMKNVNPPDGCSEATATVKGNGKYTLTTKASPDLEMEAQGYLASLSEGIQEGWLQSVTSGHLEQESCSEKPLDLDNSRQPSLSIGVIGDVANGKSTLVRAISGKRTQSHSKEKQQHGITIRLGFPNAAVLKCQNASDVCGAYSFLSESEDSGKQALPKCSKCNHEVKVVKRFSLVDCPGHAELMTTMLAGASAFDAIILAAASNVCTMANTPS